MPRRNDRVRERKVSRAAQRNGGTKNDRDVTLERQKRRTRRRKASPTDWLRD